MEPAKAKAISSVDPLLRIKYMGYCLGVTPVDGESLEFDDFVRWAKFQLCMQKNRLMEDQVWEKYTDEQVLVEYYAMVYSMDKDLRTEFESILTGVEKDTLDWFDQEIEKNKKVIEAKKKEFEKAGEVEDQRMETNEEIKPVDVEDEEGFEFSPKVKVEE